VKKSTLFTSCAIAIAGYYAGSHLGTGHTAPENHDGSSAESALHPSSGGESSGAIHGKLSKREATARYSKLRSADTLETLRQLPLDSPDLYRRLSLWLLDASKEDVAAYWQTFSQHDGFPNEIADLIFINWTRIDPKDATQSLVGSKYEHYAWWAWACHDPKGALDAAMTTNPDRINNVTWGIGEFHHKWMMEHFDEIPERNRSNAIQGLSKWGDREDPLALTDWLQSKRMLVYAMTSIFQSAIKRDPQAAFDWLLKNRNSLARTMMDGGRSMITAISENIAQQDPIALDSLIARATDEPMRRQIEEIQFDQIVQNDPEAALAKAEQTKSKNQALEQYAKVGLKLADTDPDKAFDILKKIAANNPGLTYITYTSSTFGSGLGSEQSTQSEDIVELCSKLFELDPARAVGIQLSQNEETEESSNQKSIQRQTGDVLWNVENINVGSDESPAQSWANSNPEAYAEWLNQQTDETIKQKGAEILIEKLRENSRYEEAIVWQMDTQRESISSTYKQWYEIDPESAMLWKQQADLTDNEKRTIEVIEHAAEH
jgi:hypothetical protein